MVDANELSRGLVRAVDVEDPRPGRSQAALRREGLDHAPDGVLGSRVQRARGNRRRGLRVRSAHAPVVLGARTRETGTAASALAETASEMERRGCPVEVFRIARVRSRLCAPGEVHEVRGVTPLEQALDASWREQVGRVPDDVADVHRLSRHGVHFVSALKQGRDRVPSDEAGGAGEKHSPVVSHRQHGSRGSRGRVRR
jgi:hypothetical protein